VADRKFIVYGYTYNVACRTILRIRCDAAARRAGESEIPFGDLADFAKSLVFFKSKIVRASPQSSSSRCLLFVPRSRQDARVAMSTHAPRVILITLLEAFASLITIDVRSRLHAI